MTTGITKKFAGSYRLGITYAKTMSAHTKGNLNSHTAGISLMKIYVLSLAVGLMVGVIYGLLNVRSPAPPIIALIGLLGILTGEQIPPLAKRLSSNQSAAHVWACRTVHPPPPEESFL